ncbi:toprim domain-containing protein [Pseudomonas putida]|uniref:Toprim domain-containing protein n=1 Tax=Pseudomonas putida TaxID=303 RepID=A0A7Y8D4J4_PSEPU|nr:toprim domain-containing protein [Pseudomonas putida]NWC83824.1 toprim domain-containing protein [Pseudomonas putida]
MSNYNFDAKVVREAAAGKWERIIQALIPDIPDKAFTKLGSHVACPVHHRGSKKRGDGFKLFKKDFHVSGGGMCNSCGAYPDGFSLIMWARNFTFAEALQAVAYELGIRSKDDERVQAAVNRVNDSERAAMLKAIDDKQAEDDARAREKLKCLWRESIPLTHPDAEPARLYLKGRKILCWDRPGLETVIRFHRSVKSWNENLEFEGDFPTILCLVTNAGVPVTIHRIYLTEKGEKAPIESVKKMCAYPSNRTVTGGGIITGPWTEVIDLAEGPETSLAIEMATGLKCFPMVNATLLESFVPHAGVKAIRVWADKDRSGRGEEAAKKLKVRMWNLGIQVAIMLPPLSIPEGEKGVDWNDVLVELGMLGFPRQQPRKQRAA